MFHLVLKVTRVSLCVEGYAFHFVLKVIRVLLYVWGLRVSFCVEGNTCFTLCCKVTCFTLC